MKNQKTHFLKKITPLLGMAVWVLFALSTPVRAFSAETSLDWASLYQKAQDVCHAGVPTLVEDPQACGKAINQCVIDYQSCIHKQCEQNENAFDPNTYTCNDSEIGSCDWTTLSSPSVKEACVFFGSNAVSDEKKQGNANTFQVVPHLLTPAVDTSAPLPPSPLPGGNEQAPSNPMPAPQTEGSNSVSGQGGGCSMAAGPVSGGSLGSLLSPLTMLIPVFVGTRLKKKF